MKSKELINIIKQYQLGDNGLKIITERNNIREISSIHQKAVMTLHYNRNIKVENCNPILRPLSDLTKEIEENFTQGELITWAVKKSKLSLVPYNDIKFLLDNYFDVFGLIEKGHAVSVHSINQKVY